MTLRPALAGMKPSIVTISRQGVAAATLIWAALSVACGNDAAQFQSVAASGTATGGTEPESSPNVAGTSSDPNATGGVSASGGVTSSGGSGSSNAGAAGANGPGGGGSGGSGELVPPTPIDCKTWPKAAETVALEATLEVSGVLDGRLKRYVGAGALSGDGQTEDMPPMLSLAPGSVLKNVIIGKPASDGIHCRGTCYLQNVWWEDVGEDAATLDGSDPEQSMTIECAGARHASDKIFQHNGPGTYLLTNVYAQDFGKLYRSCGNCLEQFERHVKLSNIHAEDGELLVGLNENYDDTADFLNITVESGITICSRFKGNDTGAEPSLQGSGADPEHCRYTSSEIHRP
jgi:pectate lyase